MFRKAVVLGVAVFIAGACATPTIAKEPTPGLWGIWCDWLESIGVRRASPRPERIHFYDPAPVMPVDYSYDHIVDQP